MVESQDVGCTDVVLSAVIASRTLAIRGLSKAFGLFLPGSFA